MTVGTVGTSVVGSGVGGTEFVTGGSRLSSAGAAAGEVVGAGLGAAGAAGFCAGLTGDGVGRCADGSEFGCARRAPALFAAPPFFRSRFAGSFDAAVLVGVWFGKRVGVAPRGTTTVRFESE